MKNLFDAEVVNQVKTRLGTLEPQSMGRWGKMTPAQMLAHCSVSLQWAVGETVPERAALPGRLVGRLIKPILFRNDEPIRRNAPSVKSLIVSDDRDFQTERERLLAIIERFRSGGTEGCTRHPHTFFGKLTPEEWAILMYKHLDHHLRQFGA